MLFSKGAPFCVFLQMHVHERIHRTELRERLHSLRSVTMWKRWFVSSDRRAWLQLHLPRRWVSPARTFLFRISRRKILRRARRTQSRERRNFSYQHVPSLLAYFTVPFPTSPLVHLPRLSRQDDKNNSGIYPPRTISPPWVSNVIILLSINFIHENQI